METEKYKVLIGDDEYWTREKLKKMIEWEEYNLELLEPAVDGEDVLRKIQENRPDILITDINMPYLNGVELLKILNEKYSDIITFVISGYEDFDYVKETFLAGSINYLVKPVSKIDLVNALSKVLEIIIQRKSKKQEEERKEIELKKAASLMQDREFSRLLDKRETPFTPNITMNSNMDFAGMTLMLIKIHNFKELTKQYNYDMNMLSYTLKKKIKDMIQSETTLIFNHIYRSNEFIVVNEKDNSTIENMSKKMLIDFAKITDSPVSIVLSDHSYSIDSIYQAYVQTVALLMTRPFTRKSMIITSKKQNMESENIKNHFSDIQKNELINLLKSYKKQEVKKFVFKNIGIANCENEQWEYLEVKQTVKRVLNIVLEYMTMQAAGVQEIFEMENLVEMFDNVIELLDAEYLCELMEYAIDNAMSFIQEESADSIKCTIKQAALYIDKHYFEVLTLTSLSKQYNVESSYFSRVFRKEMGVNLMLYIAKTRIAHAKEYIQKGNANLTEIAFLVGYDDYTYFNKVFRKLEGKSPRDYKGMMEKTVGGLPCIEEK